MSKKETTAAEINKLARDMFVVCSPQIIAPHGPAAAKTADMCIQAASEFFAVLEKRTESDVVGKTSA